MLLKSLLAGIVTLALLFCGAIVAMEATGLLAAGVPSAEERMEAFLAQLEAEIDPSQLPSETIDLPAEVAAKLELPWQDSERPLSPASIEPQPDEGAKAAVVAHIIKLNAPEGRRPESDDEAPQESTAEAPPEESRTLSTPDAAQPTPAAVKIAARAAPAAEPTQAPTCAAPCRAKSTARVSPGSVAPGRTRSARVADSSSGCPLLALLGLP